MEGSLSHESRTQNVSISPTDSPATGPYRSNVLLVELRPDDSRLEVIFDIRLAGKTAQRRGQRLLDMAVRILGHFHFETGDIQIGEHAIMYAAGIVEGKLHER